ncbi:MAG TPA: FkbM family methyltransferase [Steroidobacteraceae bacterium]|nr:FkbM family methyltransferase [Steroidobacteraceae bacterium]
MAGKSLVWIAKRLYPKPSATLVSRSADLLQCQVAYNRYGGYCVPESSSSRPACRAILLGDIWEPQTIELMREECGRGDIVHAGTFFGDFLPALSQAAAPNAKIWAFEPSFENYRCAKITSEINRLANVELAHAALGALRASARIRTTDTIDGALGGSAMICADGTEQVDVVTIDDVTDGRNVSIVQLDVEGYEREALEGAIAVIRRCRPLLIVEALKGSTLLESDWFAASILSLGYRITDRVHGNAVLRC